MTVVAAALALVLRPSKKCTRSFEASVARSRELELWIAEEVARFAQRVLQPLVTVSGSQ